MPQTEYKSVSSRMLDYMLRHERGMFLKAAQETSDAAMVAESAPGGPAPEPTMSETLAMMSQDPSVDPMQRQYMMEAADRIQQVDAPPPPPEQVQAQMQAQQAPPPQGAEGMPPEAMPPEEQPPTEATVEQKAASLRDSLDDFADAVNTNNNQGKLAQSKVIEDRILNMLRHPTNY
jgi:hypothetical protein